MKNEKVDIEEREQQIEALKENVLSNKKRVIEQKQAIVNKITELKKQLDQPTRIKNVPIESFSIKDIENSTEPKESKAEIAKKIAALNEASQLPIWCDKKFMDSVHEYLNAIRPVVEELEQKQFESVKLIKEKELEAKEYIDSMNRNYLTDQAEIKKLIAVVDNGLAWSDSRYDKRVSNTALFTDIIDNALKVNDGNKFTWLISLH